VTHGSLSLRAGVLYVARHARTAHVRPYDLDGRALSPGFSFRGPHGESCELGGIDVDSDHQVWIADAGAAALRAFNLFGRETAALAGLERARDDARGAIRNSVDVAVSESESELTLIVASSGWRRHAVQLFQPDGRCVESLRPEGNPLGRFHGVSRVAAHGRWIHVCEPSAGRVQVFREREFHFAFAIPAPAAGRFEPVAVAPLAGGRMIVATGGEHSALLLVDAGGRLARVLAEHGGETGRVLDPGDVVADEGADDRTTRIAVIDRDAERVQVFTLEGACHGEIDALPGQATEGLR